MFRNNRAVVCSCKIEWKFLRSSKKGDAFSTPFRSIRASAQPHFRVISRRLNLSNTRLSSAIELASIRKSGCRSHRCIHFAHMRRNRRRALVRYIDAWSLRIHIVRASEIYSVFFRLAWAISRRPWMHPASRGEAIYASIHLGPLNGYWDFCSSAFRLSKVAVSMDDANLRRSVDSTRTPEMWVIEMHRCDSSRAFRYFSPVFTRKPHTHESNLSRDIYILSESRWLPRRAAALFVVAY